MSVVRSFYFLLNSESGRAMIAEKYEKDRKGNQEDVALLKRPDVI